MLASCVMRWVGTKSGIIISLIDVSTARAQGDSVANRDTTFIEHIGIDAGVDVAEVLLQRERNIEIARGGFGIDIGRGAAADRLDAAQPHAGNREFAPYPIEFLPRRRTLETEI